MAAEDLEFLTNRSVKRNISFHFSPSTTFNGFNRKKTRERSLSLSSILTAEEDSQDDIMNDSGFQRQVKDLEHDFQNAMETMQFKFQDELKVKDEKIKDLENQLKDKNSFIVRLETTIRSYKEIVQELEETEIKNENSKLSINQYNIGKVEKKSGCTTEGCNGEGNINAAYKKHHSVKNCPMKQRIENNQEEIEFSISTNEIDTLKTKHLLEKREQNIYIQQITAELNEKRQALEKSVFDHQEFTNKLQNLEQEKLNLEYQIRSKDKIIEKAESEIKDIRKQIKLLEIGQEEKICEIQERELNVRMLEKQIKSSQETVYELQQELDFKSKIIKRQEKWIEKITNDNNPITSKSSCAVQTEDIEKNIEFKEAFEKLHKIITKSFEQLDEVKKNQIYSVKQANNILTQTIDGSSNHLVDSNITSSVKSSQNDTPCPLCPGKLFNGTLGLKIHFGKKHK